MNCKYCGKPIQEHGIGRETDACVARWMGEEEMEQGYPILRTAQHYTTTDAAMRVWETLPKPRLLMEFPDAPPTVYTHHTWNTHAETLELAICHAALVLAAKEE